MSPISEIEDEDIVLPKRIGVAGRIARQGTLLFSGYAAAQSMSFARNALIGHALSKGEFGIATTIALLLQIIETITDIGADRLIVQADDGATQRFVSASHTLYLVRGVILAILMLAIGPLIAAAFNIPQAGTAFAVAAVVPLIKGFSHLDWRRAQRCFNNAPHVLIDVAPQAIALFATLPALAWTGDFSAVAWLALVQALATVAVSHAIAARPYRLAFDAAILKRQFAFGWPILASALPLVAVYQGDRIIIAHVGGMEALASFTAAFMVTMVPGLIAAKVGHSLMLPMFSEAQRLSGSVRRPLMLMAETITLVAAVFLAVFVIAGDSIVTLVFSDKYAGLGRVAAWLAAMWAMRMIQAVPGMALMARGETRPFLVAGIIRAHAVPVVAYAAYKGYGLDVVAAIGCAFEALTLAYICLRLDQVERGLGWILCSRATYLIPAGLVSILATLVMPQSPTGIALSLGLVIAVIAACGAAAMPGLRGTTRNLLKCYAGFAAT
jgi:O-antigen/teichoic acid export membrane protein